MWGAGNTGDRRPQLTLQYTHPLGDDQLITKFGIALTGAVGGSVAEGGLMSGEDSGRPMLNARVGWHGKTDAGGAFRFGDLPQGTWTITLEPLEERETTPLEPTVVRVAAGSDATRVELRTYVPRFVAGRCVDPDGEPLAWVELGVVRDGALVASGFSDERGAFQVGPVPDGAVTLTAITCPTTLRRPPDVSIDAGASGLEVRFERR